MPCYCFANTLRSFVRTIAKVDLPVPAKQFQPLPIRRFGNSNLQHYFHITSRTYSSTHSAIKDAKFSTDSSSAEPGEGTSRNDGVTSKASRENAFVDFSPDAIDALVAESKSRPMIEDDTPAGFVSRTTASQIASRNSKLERSQGVEPTFRRMQSENTSFHIHYSSPRQPASIKRSTADRVGTRTRSRSVSEEWIPPKREHWQIDKEARKKKYPDGWNPQKRLSPDAMAGIRALHTQEPEKYNTRALAESFAVSPEAISRILKSNWAPSADEESDRQRRWFKRGENVWSRYAELGVKPPKKWRELGIGKGKPESTKRKWSEVKPALVTLPRRAGGNYSFDGEDAADGFENRIL